MSLLRRIDRLWYRAEWLGVSVAMMTMTLIVFFDVVDRRLRAPDSKLAAWLCAALRTTEEASPWIGTYLAPALGFAIAAGLLWFALATLRDRGSLVLPGPVEPLLAAIGAAALFGFGWFMLHRPSRECYALAWALVLGATVLVQLRARREGWQRRAPLLVLLLVAGAAALYAVVPEGYSWAKEVAMLLLVWSSFIGGSMTSHLGGHIEIEFGRKLWPRPLRKAISILRQLAILGFCLFFCYFAVRYVFGPGGPFSTGERTTHTEIPAWLVAVPIPIALGAMGLRTLLVILKILGGDVEAKGSGNEAPPSMHGEPPAKGPQVGASAE